MLDFIEQTGHPVWKYRLTEEITFNFEHDIGHWFNVAIDLNADSVSETDYYLIDLRGITLKVGYAWNGLTCFPDIQSALKASAFHDCLLGENGKEIIKDPAWRSYAAIHRVFRDVLRKDNGWLLTNTLYQGVRIFHPITLKF